MKAHAQFQHRSHPPGNLHTASRRLRGAGNHFEQSAFTRAVNADDAHRFSGVDGKAHVLHNPFQLMALFVAGQDPLSQAAPAVGILLVSLPEAGNGNGAHQSSSTISPAWPRYRRIPMTQSTSDSATTGQSEYQLGH